MHAARRPRNLAIAALALAGGGAGAVVALTATTLSTASAQSGAKATKKQIICRARLVEILPPGTQTETYGTVSCTGAAFGEGIQHATAQLTRQSETAASLRGRFRIYFDTGTLRGTYRAGVMAANEIATWTGATKVTSGTGALSGTTGSGTIAGTSRDGVHTTLTERFTLTVRAPAR